jgi:hypothetical protein
MHIVFVVEILNKSSNGILKKIFSPTMILIRMIVKKLVIKSNKDIYISLVDYILFILYIIYIFIIFIICHQNKITKIPTPNSHNPMNLIIITVNMITMSMNK